VKNLIIDLINMIDPQIESSWKEVLRDEFQKPYFIEIKNFLQKEKSE
jgi:uracil-DNA glycosylase